MSTFAIHGGFAGLAASTRVRLARNLKGYPYRLTEAQRTEIADKVWQTIENTPALAAEFTRTKVQPGSAEAGVLVERHQISPELAQSGGELIASKDGGAAIMVGEEDHLRIQVLGTGLCPRECMTEARRLADLIEAAHPMDYSEQLGYLTACPSNLGTGLRVSIMLHLPALTRTGALEQMIGWAGQRGLTVRGAYGEGSRALGGFYQLSNQVTLGMSEDAIVERLTQAATEVIENEKKARERLRAADEDGLTDTICRAAGTLQTARRMTGNEAAELLSAALMGLQMGILTGVTPESLVQAEQDTRPAVLGGVPADRDRRRAALLRQATAGMKCPD